MADALGAAVGRRGRVIGTEWDGLTDREHFGDCCRQERDRFTDRARDADRGGLFESRGGIRGGPTSPGRGTAAGSPRCTRRRGTVRISPSSPGWSRTAPGARSAPGTDGAPWTSRASADTRTCFNSSGRRGAVPPLPHRCAGAPLPLTAAGEHRPLLRGDRAPAAAAVPADGRTGGGGRLPGGRHGGRLHLPPRGGRAACARPLTDGLRRRAVLPGAPDGWSRTRHIRAPCL